MSKIIPIIIGLNGPPRVGKSWLAIQLKELFGNRIHSMSYGELIYEGLASEESWLGTYEDFKAHVFDDGISGRQKLIDRGDWGRAQSPDYWTQQLIEHRRFGTRSIMVLDGIGFPDEQNLLERASRDSLITVIMAPSHYSIGERFEKPDGGLDNRTCLSPRGGFRVTDSNAALAVFKRLLNVPESPEPTVYSHFSEPVDLSDTWRRLRLVKSMVDSTD